MVGEVADGHVHSRILRKQGASRKNETNKHDKHSHRFNNLLKPLTTTTAGVRAGYGCDGFACGCPAETFSDEYREFRRRYPARVRT